MSRKGPILPEITGSDLLVAGGCKKGDPTLEVTGRRATFFPGFELGTGTRKNLDFHIGARIMKSSETATDRQPYDRKTILPRLLRFRDAPGYLGMDRNRFNREVRPFVTDIPIGRQGVAFDRLELDAWTEEYVSRNGRPGRIYGGTTWDERKRQDSTRDTGYGESTSASEDGEFARALALINSKKPSAI